MVQESVYLYMEGKLTFMQIQNFHADSKLSVRRK